MAAKKSKTLKQAILDLFDKDDSKVMKSLKTITKSGTADEIPALMDVYVKAEEGPIKDELTKMLSSMKLEGGDIALVSLLREERFRDHHTFILTSIWNSGYQPIEHLDIIVNVGLQGDYMTTFEVLTIIENLEPPFDMDVIAVAALNVDDYLEDNQPDERTPIIEQIKQLLEHYKTAVAN
ncbi:MAG: hypothetical protein HKN45_03960 [Flavobacteriales bacterium]|nr:hypothetical protein [Flavobacteriales bacterium]